MPGDTGQAINDFSTAMQQAMAANNSALLAALSAQEQQTLAALAALQPAAAAPTPTAAPTTAPTVTAGTISQLSATLFGPGNNWSSLNPANQLAEWTQTLQTLAPGLGQVSSGVFTTAFNWLNGTGQKYTNPYAAGSLVGANEANANVATVINALIAGKGIPDTSTLLTAPVGAPPPAVGPQPAPTPSPIPTAPWVPMPTLHP